MWNLSNSLSILRMILAIPICWAIWNNSVALAVSLGIIAMATDYFDGFFARKLNQITEAGKILDPLADKVLAISVVITLALMDKIPLWLTIMIFARDILILLGGLMLSNKLKYVIPSNQTGKWTVLFLALYIIYTVLGLNFFHDIILTFIALMLVISFVHYLISGFTLWRNADVTD